MVGAEWRSREHVRLPESPHVDMGGRGARGRLRAITACVGVFEKIRERDGWCRGDEDASGEAVARD